MTADENGKQNLSHKVRSEVAMTSVFQAFGMAVDIIYLAILSRLLSPADFGIVAAATLFLAFCNLLREIGIGATIVQLKSLSEIEQRTALTLVLISSLILFLLAQFAAPLFADFMNLPEAGIVLRVLSVVIIIQAFGSISEGLLLRGLDMRRIRIVEILAKTFAYGIPGVALAYAGYGYWALAAATICEMSVRSAALVVLAKPVLRPTIDRASVRRLMGTGSGFTASRIFNFIALRGDVTIVGRYMDAASLGLYSRAFRLMNLPTEVYAKMADRVVFPAMAKVQSDPERLKAAFLKGAGLTALFGMPMSVLLYILSPEVIRVLLGRQWDEVIPVFSFLAIATYFRLASRVSGALLRATASIKALISSQAAYAVMTVGGTLFAVQYGLPAVAIAVSTAIFVTFCVMTVQACKVVKVSFLAFLAEHRHATIMSVLSGVPVYLIAFVARREELNAFVILLIEAGFLVLLFVALIYWMPARIMGKEGAEFASHIRKMFVSKVLRKRGPSA